jgi:hypothetical protein
VSPNELVQALDFRFLEYGFQVHSNTV